MRSVRITVLLLSMLAGCAGAPVAPFTSPPPQESKLNNDQKVVWRESDEQDEMFQNMGATLDDPALQGYLQGVVDRLYPDFKGSIRVYILKSTVPNAFMMANGSCYVQLGLLPLLQDEAGLAMVLSHEGIHFVNQHGVQEHVHASNTVVAAMILGVAVPIVGPAIALSSIYGYSVEMETQADQVGYTRYLKAGYPAGAAVAPFVALDQYSQAMGIKESYFYADHPKLQSRIAYFRSKAANTSATGDAGEAGYLAATQKARLWVLQELLARHDQQTLIFLLGDSTRMSEYPTAATYYLASAYALRGGDGDAARAEALYRDALTKAPDFAPSYKALGEILMRRGDGAEATRMFQSYLRLAPDAPDRAYINSYLQRLSSAPPPNGSKGI